MPANSTKRSPRLTSGAFRQLKKVVREYGTVIVGVGLTRLVTFAASVILAHRLSVSGFGAYAFAYSISLLLGQLPGTIDSSFVRHYAMADDDSDRRSYLRSQLYIKLVLAVALAVVGVGLVLFGPRTLLASASSPLLIAGIVAGCSYSIISTGLSAYQAEERFVSYAATSFGVNLVGLLVLIGYVLVARPTALGSMLTFNTGVYSLAALGVVVWLWRRSAQRSVALRAYWARLVRFSGWLLPAGACYILLTRVDILLLGSYRAGREVGLYGGALTISTVITLFTSTLPIFFVPRAARSISSRDALGEYLVQATLTSAAIVGLIPIAVLASPWLLRLALGPEYVSATGVLRILLVGQAFIAVEPPLTALAYATGRTRLVFFERLLELAVATTGCVLLIPHLSGVGAAWSVAVAYSVGSLMMGVSITRTVILPRMRDVRSS